MVAKRKALTPIILACASLHTTPVWADSNADWAAAFVKYGTSMGSAIAQSSPANQLPSALPPSAEREAIDETLRAYSQAKASDESTITGMQGTANLFIDGTAAVVIGATEGTATVPTILIKGAAQAAFDSYFNALKADSQRQLRAYLATRGEQILQRSGLSLAALAGNRDPEDIGRKLTQNGELLRDMAARLPNDASIKDMTTGLLIETLQNTAVKEFSILKAHGEKFDKLGASVRTLDTRLDKLDKLTQAELAAQSARIHDIGDQVTSLNTTVVSLDARLAHNEKLTSFVADFVFSNMSAADKVSALQSGTFDDQFACTDQAASCDASLAN